MTGLKEGERMKYQKDGRVFEIAKISRDLVVLQALDDSTQVLTGKASLDFLFAELSPDRGPGSSPVPGRIVPLLSSVKRLDRHPVKKRLTLRVDKVIGFHWASHTDEHLL